ncbi:hypothetical protein K2W90_05640 [Candidatus Babeliales bacterium]|nr:hypothetical protein [Candidatus Babeliales bacterium]
MNKRTIVLAIFYSLQASLCLADQSFTEDEIKNIVKQTINEVAQSKYNPVKPQTSDDAAQKISELTASQLRDYKITGCAVGTGFSCGLGLGLKKTTFDMLYKNNEGSLLKRSYTSVIPSLGLKCEISYNLDFIFFVNTDTNFYDSNKELPLDLGLNFGANNGTTFLPGINMTYAPFLNMLGGIMMVSIPIFSLSLPMFQSNIVSGSLFPKTNNTEIIVVQS